MALVFAVCPALLAFLMDCLDNGRKGNTLEAVAVVPMSPPIWLGFLQKHLQLLIRCVLD